MMTKEQKTIFEFFCRAKNKKFIEYRNKILQFLKKMNMNHKELTYNDIVNIVNAYINNVDFPKIAMSLRRQRIRFTLLYLIEKNNLQVVCDEK